MNRLQLPFSQFLQTYHKQLRHANVMVMHSTQHGLYEAVQRFHPDMPCVRRSLSMYCRVHNTYHDRFVHYMHLLGFCISLPPVRRNTPGKLLPSTNGWTRATSACVMPIQPVGYWRRGNGAWKASPHGTECRCLYNRTSVPHNCAFVTDGSWFPSHCGGGALAVVCLDTLTWVIYPVSVPFNLDDSYAVEVYTSWLLCRVRHTLLASGTAACATARSLREGRSFTDSRSYIQALSSSRPAQLGEGLVDLLLSNGIKLAGPAPTSLFSPAGHFSRPSFR